MRKFKFNIDEPIEIQLYNGGMLFGQYKARLKTIQLEKGKKDLIIFEQIAP